MQTPIRSNAQRAARPGAASAVKGAAAKLGATLLLIPLLGGLLGLRSPLIAPAQAQYPPQTHPAVDTGLPDDVLLGLQITVTLTETIGVVENEAWRERVNRIGYRVAAAGGESDIPYSFDILDLPEPNAMALPGGFLFITRGMMEIGLTDDELAHLLGHEISHVDEHHFRRAAQMNTLLSLVNTALLIGILVGAPDDAGGGQRIERTDDPGRRDWAVGSTGKEALVQGASLFGSVFQALFSRSYSRKLEFEADERGSRLAVRAGYRPESGPTLLQKLHERSYEGQRFGYWRTHPYFNDRIHRTRGLSARLTPPSEPPPDAPFRERAALFFAAAAERIPGEREALCLYERALRCARSGLASLDGGYEMLRFKTRREERRHELLRGYRPLEAAYDSLVARAEHEEPQWDRLTEAQAERSRLEEHRLALLEDYLEVVDREGVSTALLERFVENYPEHERFAEMTCRLATHYRLTERTRKAVDLLEPLLAAGSEAAVDAAAADWADSARVILLDTIAELDDLDTCYRLIVDWSSRGEIGSAFAAAAEERMTQLIDADLSLQTGGRFLENHPETAWSERIRAQVLAAAEKSYLSGRVHEGLKRYQDALDAYFAVLAYAGNTPIADQALEGVDRISRLENLAVD